MVRKAKKEGRRKRGGFSSRRTIVKDRDRDGKEEKEKGRVKGKGMMGWGGYQGRAWGARGEKRAPGRPKAAEQWVQA